MYWYLLWVMAYLHSFYNSLRLYNTIYYYHYCIILLYYSHFTNESEKLRKLPKVMQLLNDKAWMIIPAYLTLKLLCTLSCNVRILEKKNIYIIVLYKKIWKGCFARKGEGKRFCSGNFSNRRHDRNWNFEVSRVRR